MCEAIGKKVLALHRTKIENIEVRPLKIGEWRYLTEKEVRKPLQKVNNVIKSIKCICNIFSNCTVIFYGTKGGF